MQKNSPTTPTEPIPATACEVVAHAGSQVTSMLQLAAVLGDAVEAPALLFESSPRRTYRWVSSVILNEGRLEPGETRHSRTTADPKRLGVQKLSLSPRLVASKGPWISEGSSALKIRSSTAFNDIRQLVADSDIKHYEEIYEVLFDKVDEYSNNKQTLVILTLAEYIYQSAMVVNREITFMACIAKLLKDLK